MTNVSGATHMNNDNSELTSVKNKKEVERKRQILCDKHDNYFVQKNFQLNKTFLLTRSFHEKPENIMLSEDHSKTHK